MQTEYSNGPEKTFTAHVPASLLGKESYLVQERVDGTIELFDDGLAIGTLINRLEHTNEWTVRLFGSGTSKVKCAGAIDAGTRVKGQSGGTVIALGSSGRSLGIKVTPGTSAAGDVIEINDVVENV